MDVDLLYLNKGGLKKLAEAICKLFRKTWHGTRTEWDALDEEEKDKWEQAEIEEEDGNNGNGVVYVADKVEKGNYNPVTSNAVAGFVKAVSYFNLEAKPENILFWNASTQTVINGYTIQPKVVQTVIFPNIEFHCNSTYTKDGKKYRDILIPRHFSCNAGTVQLSIDNYSDITRDGKAILYIDLNNHNDEPVTLIKAWFTILTVQEA